MKFEYKAKDKEGKVQTGMIVASSKEAAFLVLQNYELYLISIKEKKTPFFAKEITLFQHVSQKDVVMLSRQLAVMFESKIPIVESLQTIARQIQQRGLKEKILSVAEKVEGGVPLSKAFAIHPDIFSSFYVSMVKSGEASGKLSEIFTYLADHIEREYGFRQKLIAAMFYPLFILCVFGGVLMFLFIVVMPELTDILIEAGSEVPMITQIVMGISEFLREYGWFVFLGIYSAVVFFIKFFTTEQGKKIIDEFIFKIPSFGTFFKKMYVSRFAESISTLISGGLSIAHSLEITAEVMQNKVYKEIVLDIREGVEKGRQMSEVMNKYQNFFPPLLVQMVIVGEKSGRLSASLMSVVRFFRGEVERTINSYVSLIEPVLIIVLGGLVGGLVVSVLLPIYNMGMGS